VRMQCAKCSQVTRSGSTNGTMGLVMAPKR
jgi:hypothetical protein